MSGASSQYILVSENHVSDRRKEGQRKEGQIGSINITIKDSDVLDTTTINFHGPQFIVNSKGRSLDLSMADKTSVISHPFHGGANQQWIIYDYGHGQFVLMSRYDRTCVAPKEVGSDARLVSQVEPCYWRVSKNGAGYRLRVPDSELGLSLGNSARLRPLSEDPEMCFYILENNAENRTSIKSGNILQADPKTASPAKKGNSTGAAINITVNNYNALGLPADMLGNLQNLLTINGIRYPATSLAQWHSAMDPLISTSIVSNNSSGHDNSRTPKLTISQTAPVPTASPGVADIVAFGASGVVVVRNRVKLRKHLVIPNFGYDAGWRTEKHVRLLADTTGNKQADVVGFGETHVWISSNNGDNMFKKPKQVTSEFSYAAGWRVDKHLRFMADIRNTGRADIVGFGDTGVLISSNNGDESFGPARLALDSFGYNAGDWRIEKHLRFLADVDGRGVLDIIGFGETQVWIARNNGDGTFQAASPVLADLCYSQGWRVDQHPRLVADLTGDGALDLVGFGDEGVYVAFNNGDGTFQPARIVIVEFCSKTGWETEDHLRFIADLTGNGCGDIVGIGEYGVYMALNKGDGTFEPSMFFADILSPNTNWKVDKHPRFVADMTGNGRPDLVGFGDNAVYVSYNDGKGNFVPEEELISGLGAEDVGWAAENSVKYVVNLHA